VTGPITVFERANDYYLIFKLRIYLKHNTLSIQEDYSTVYNTIITFTYPTINIRRITVLRAPVLGKISSMQEKELSVTEPVYKRALRSSVI
jgi:hypothetical protein